jgi:tripartite-type tricarboxylate transporter receptor subunit TctC
LDSPSSLKTSVERTGASVSAGLLARDPGYTIDLGFLGNHVLNGAFYSLPYEVLNDFAPISPLVTSPGILFARKSILAKDLKELIAWLKANPNKGLAIADEVIQ